MANNLIAHIAKDFMSGESEEVVDICTFVEASWGLGINLLPAQRFMLKCVSGDNIIVGNDGVPCTVREFCKSGSSTVSTFDDSDWKIKTVRHQGAWSSGCKEVYRLTTKRFKRWIEVTGDHRILTPSGYKRLDELKKGDVVVVSEREPFPQCSSELEEWEADSDICWDKVEDIESVGEKDVYDIAVPHTHNFLIGGIVVHNCFYGMELNDAEKTIEVPDILNEKILYRLTERQFLDFLVSEGRCNTNVVEGVNFHEMVLVLGRRGTKCRSMDDLIPTTKGSMTFKELLERSYEERIGIFTYDQDSLRRSVTYDYSIWDNGTSDCYKVETSRSFSETSSWNHPYFVWRESAERPEWVYARDLREGDSIAVSNELPAFGPPSLGCERASVLGYLIGDGGITCSVTFTTASQDQLDDFTRCVKKEFGKYEVVRKGTDPLSICYEVVKESRRRKQDGSQKNLIKEWLAEIGLMGKNSHTKRVPDCVLKASRQEVAVFLSRLFACDGHANTESKTYKGHSNPKSHIGYCSISRDLCDDVRHLLLKFGVHCTICPTTVKCNGKKHKAWMLRIVRQDSMALFEREIGIFSKEDAVRRAVKAAREREEPKSELESLPIGVWNYIKRVKKTRGLKNVDFTGCHGAGNNERLRMQYAPSRRKVEQYGKNVGDQWLIDMGTSDVRWDKVKSVDHVGEMETVDLCVKGTHVIGGEIVSHNSTMASCISNYELYKLVKRSDPSRFYGFPANTEIAILNVAPTDEQAGTVFNMIKSQALGCPYLRDRSLNQTMDYFNLQTDSDKKLHGKPKASLLSISGGCSSNALRGKNAIVVIMDEMAFFIDKANSRFSGAEVYKALTPSMTDFGEHGKVLCLSSPYGKFGRFYERFQESFEEPDYTLMFKMYTAMANPRVPSDILRAAYRRDKTAFMCEYGGEFSDRVTAWIESETEFMKNVHDRPMVTRGDRETQYFMGIDLGFKNDGTAIAIVHKEGSKIVLDYADVWFGSESDVWAVSESIYHDCAKYSSKPILKMADIVEEVKSLSRWFGIKSGIFDQAGGWGFMELLNEAGFKQIEMKHFSDTLNAEVYQLAKMLYGEQLLDLHNHPVLVPELLSLEAERRSKGKVIVEAPNREGAHDDISDAFVRAVWKCYNASSGRANHIATGAGGSVGVTGKLSRGDKVVTQQQAMLSKRKMHGDHPRGLDRLKKRRPGAVRR